MAESRLVADPPAAAALIAEAREEAKLAVKELRELASGIHPALLSERGLGPALEALAARAPVPTTVDGVPAERLPPPVESAAYFVTAEALTNVAKYAGAMSAGVSLAIEHGRLRLLVRDDGAGGADPAKGHRPARPQRPRRGARRRPPRRLPTRPRHHGHRRDPPRRPSMRLLAPAPARPRRLAAAGCGGGPRVSQTREVAPFERIDVRGSVDVEVVPGRLARRRGVGRRERDRPRQSPTRTTACCTCRSATAASSSARTRSTTRACRCPPTRCRACASLGSSDLQLGHVEADELSIEVKGSGDVEAAGTVGNLIATIQGSGDADLRDLEARTARVSVQGSGDAQSTSATSST